MNTKIVETDSNNPDEKILDEAADILRQGGLVAFPTETVYGLGGNGLDFLACKKIYKAKGRPSDNPLILHIGALDQLNNIVKEIPDMGKAIIDRFWPGPITLIFEKTKIVPDEVTGGLDTVAVRFPSNIVARSLIKKAKVPIAAPSANSSGKPSPTRAYHVEFDLSGKIDMIIDGGATDFGLESTILDVTGNTACLLRPGAITKEMIEEVIGTIDVDPVVTTMPKTDIAPKAPGMKYTHYSPNASVILIKGDIINTAKKINEFADISVNKGIKVGIMATEETKKMYRTGIVLSLGSRNNLREIGSNLFKLLREFDYLDVDIIYCEFFEEKNEGRAIMNRLKKSAGYNIIEI